MCRSSADGGRRCPTHSDRDRTRALNTANQQVSRARARLNAAQQTGDHAAITDAADRLADAHQHLADVHAAHTAPKTPAQSGDTTHTDSTAHDTDTASTGEQQHSQPIVGERNEVNYDAVTMQMGPDGKFALTRDETPAQSGDTTHTDSAQAQAETPRTQRQHGFITQYNETNYGDTHFEIRRGGRENS